MKDWLVEMRAEKTALQSAYRNTPSLQCREGTGLLETSKPTAGKAIERLIAAGILAEVEERKRHRPYRYDNYLKLLE